MIPNLPIPFNTGIPLFVVPIIFAGLILIAAVLGLWVGFYFTTYFLVVELIMIIIASLTIGIALQNGNNAITQGLTGVFENLLASLVTTANDNTTLVATLSEYVSIILSDIIYYLIFIFSGILVSIITYFAGWRFLLKKIRLPKIANRVGGLLSGAVLGVGIGAYAVLPFSYSVINANNDESFLENDSLLQFLINSLNLSFPGVPNPSDIRLIETTAREVIDTGNDIQEIIASAGTDITELVERITSDPGNGELSTEIRIINILVSVTDVVGNDNTGLFDDIIIGALNLFVPDTSDIRIPPFLYQSIIRRVVEQRPQGINEDILIAFQNAFVSAT